MEVIPGISPTEKRMELFACGGKFTKCILKSTSHTSQPLIPVLQHLHVFLHLGKL
jgi:hypothetical protein